MWQQEPFVVICLNLKLRAKEGTCVQLGKQRSRGHGVRPTVPVQPVYHVKDECLPSQVY